MNERILTEEDKTRIIASVYSNPKKLAIATQIFKLKEATGKDLAELLSLPASTVNEALKEMLENGIVARRRESYFVHYSLTELGKKLVTLFN